MAELIAGPFAEVLEADRAGFNARFHEVRQAAPNLDGAEFASVLTEIVSPIVDAVAHDGDGFTSAVANELYDIALELCAARRMESAIQLGWQQLLPKLGRQLSADPRRVIASITNALSNLDHMPGARPDEWVTMMRSVAEHVPSTDELLMAGQVAAWIAGMAQARTAALALAGDLGPDLLEAFMRRELLAALHDDPWLDPRTGERTTEIVRVGSFHGLGGPFAHPPIVGSLDGVVLASDGESWWRLFADACGAVAVRSAEAPGVQYPSTSADAPTEASSIAEISSWTRVPGGLAVTSGLSFAVAFLPERAGS